MQSVSANECEKMETKNNNNSLIVIRDGTYAYIQDNKK